MISYKEQKRHRGIATLVFAQRHVTITNGHVTNSLIIASKVHFYISKQALYKHSLRNRLDSAETLSQRLFCCTTELGALGALWWPCLSSMEYLDTVGKKVEDFVRKSDQFQHACTTAFDMVDSRGLGRVPVGHVALAAVYFFRWAVLAMSALISRHTCASYALLQL